MNKRIEELKGIGCEIDDAMERFLDDEEFYLECYDALLQDEKFSELGVFIEKHDEKGAFECAHTLKGLTSNLGLSSLNRSVVVIVDNIGTDYDSLMAEYEKYKSI